MLVFLIVVKLSDVFSYLWGKLAGMHRILPTISPNTTWEGLVGGVLSATLAAVSPRLLTPFSMPETAMIAFLASAAGFCGGAVMSAVKRDFGAKDFGTLIPGHGGMIDRIDSLCFAAPVFLRTFRFLWC